jgi:hypothetical protein
MPTGSPAHQHSPLVARSIEVIALEEATTPDTNQVDIGRRGLVEPAPDSFSSDPGQKMIIGYPVDTLDEHRLAVDRNGECSANLVAGGDQVDGAETDSPLPAVQFLIGCRQGEIEIGQRLVAVANRPPQRRIGNIDDEHCAGGAGLQLDHGLLADDFGGDCEWCIGVESFQIDPELDSTVSGLVHRDQRHHPSQSSNAPTLQPHRLPQTRGP